MDIDRLKAALEEQLGRPFGAARLDAVGGGSINRAYRAMLDDGAYFVKTNRRSRLAMFEAEADGLAALGRADALRVPSVLAVGAATDLAFLVLEWVELGARDASAERALGRGLARQHRVTSSDFGWHRDNTIGSTPQRNAPCDDWTTFFGELRLRPQLELARQNGMPASALAAVSGLLERLDEVLDGHRPQPSLLHGDLWGGNWGATAEGGPVVFDPAVYFGDREADLAMTRLFGGFGRSFYDAYEADWPLPAGAERRATLYNLYHLLNHFNLFGAGYLGSLRAAIDRLARG